MAFCFWHVGLLFRPTFRSAFFLPHCSGVVLVPVLLRALGPSYGTLHFEHGFPGGSGLRRDFFAPKEWQGRTVLLTFGAVAHDATVFCNGRRVFHHGCGYTAFTVDLTESLLLGQKNVVAVRCDSRRT